MSSLTFYNIHTATNNPPNNPTNNTNNDNNWNRRPRLTTGQSDNYLSKYRTPDKRRHSSYQDVTEDNTITRERRISESSDAVPRFLESEGSKVTPATDYGRTTLDIASTEQLMDASGKEYTVYVIHIMDAELHHWVKRYRYSDLLLLHKHLMKNYPALLEKPFPSKTYTMKKSSAEVIDWRKFLLQKYLRYIINHDTLNGDAKVLEYLFDDE